MDKNDSLEYLNQSRYFVGVEDYEEALKYINKSKTTIGGRFIKIFS